jgi:ribulose-phosphate 3-epimerase
MRETCRLSETIDVVTVKFSLDIIIIALGNQHEMSGFRPLRAMIGPSVLAGDMSNLAAETIRMMEFGADYIHLDVMDGHFVPNLTFGAPVIECLRKHTSCWFDVHLMVSEPERWVGSMAKAGANTFTFHVEVGPTERLFALIDCIKAANMKVGIAVKPHTPICALDPFFDKVDQVLVMTVEPGFGGQSFMGEMMSKVRAVRSLHPHMDIQVDGGIDLKNIEAVSRAGANMIVAGSSIFKAAAPAETIASMKRYAF